jgi:hypothetical protein
MKKALMVLSSLLVAVGAFAQGQVNFANRVVGSYDAPVFVGSLTGAKADGPTYMAQLYAGPSATTLAAIGAPIPFRTGAAAGYITSSTQIIPTVAPGAVAQVQMRAWATAAGATYEAALAANGGTGQSAILAITTGGAGSPPSLPANLDGLASFAIVGGVPNVPEPSVLALGALGGLALLIRRRK